MVPKIEISGIRREELTQAALKCIAAKGYDRVTLDDVTREAGLSKGIASYYFKNKEDLLLSVIRRMWEDMISLTRNIWGLPEGVEEGKGLAKKLRYYYSNQQIDLVALTKDGIVLFLAWLDENPNIIKVIIEFWCHISRNPVINRVNHAMQKYLLDISSVFIQEGIQRGIFKKRNPRLAAYTLLSLVIGFAFNQCIFERKFDNRELEKALSDLIFSYLMG